MRDKFRAKRTDNGKWVYGELTFIPESDDDPILKIKSAYIWNRCQFKGKPIDNGYEIDYAIVDQCVGVRDNNGHWIYTGDILRSTDKYGHAAIGIVEHCTVECGVGSSFEKFGRLPFRIEWKNARAGDEIEVIGNIHDNPSLLEVSE